MLIEFQLNPTAFLATFRNQLKLIPACLPEPLDISFGDCDGPSLLDHIHISKTTSLVKTQIGSLRIHQPVKLFFVSVDELEAHGANPTPPCFSPTLTLVFNLTLAFLTDAPSICINYVEATAPGLTEKDQQLIDDILSGALTQQCKEIDLGPLSALLDAPVSVLGAGLSANASLDRLAVRLEVVSSGPSQAWSDFFAGELKPNPKAEDWSVFFDKKLLEKSIENRFLAALEPKIEENKFSLDSGPDCDYSSFAGIPLFEVVFTGEAINACVCLWGQIDLNVDIFADIILSVPEENVIQLKLALDWDVNNAETICCAFTTSIFWFFIGTNLLIEEKINFGEFAAGLGMPVSFTNVLLTVHDKVGEKIELPAEWEEIGSSGTKFRLRQEVDFGTALLAKVTLNSVHATSGGPVLGGSIGGVTELKSPELSVFMNFAEFTWGIVDPCADELVLAAVSSIGLGNKDASPGIPQVPLFVCDVRIVDDSMDQFEPYLQWDHTGSINFSITTDQLKPEYKANPYACKLWIITNGGVRIVTIPPIPILSDAEIQQRLDEAKMKQIIDCKDDMAFGNPFWKGSKFNPKWGPDPGPEEVVYLQLWDVIITGLIPNENVRLEDVEGHLLADGNASAKGMTELSALVQAGGEERKSGISLLRTTAGRERTPQQTITIKQVALIGRGEVAAAAPILDLCAGRFQGAPAVAFATKHGCYIYDLLMPGFSRLAHHAPDAGLRGVLGWQGGFLIWGERGLRLTGDGSSVALVEAPVIDVVFAGSRLYVLTPVLLAIYDRKFREVGSLSLRGGTRLAISDKTLAVMEGGLIQFYDVSSPERPERKAAQKVTDLVALESAPLAESRSAFFARKVGGGGSVFAVSGNKVIEAVRFNETPWFSQFRRTGRTLARIGPDSQHVQLYFIAKTETRLR